jgi:hypothetical protein
MKLAVFAASAMFGVASFASASFAQGDGFAATSRTPQTDSTATSSRMAAPAQAPTLEPARPVPGMLPHNQTSGPVRGASGSGSEVAAGSDIRSDLRRQ